MNLDLADHETGAEMNAPDPPDDDEAEDASELPIDDRWNIEGSESGG